MLEMPSGHTAPDGQLDFSIGAVGNQQRYSLNFVALPWLEATFRYSHAVGLNPGYDDWHFYDRSFAVKVRLLKENASLPDVSVGIRDLLGTGTYSSEFLAASKHFGLIDITGGLGWGQLAERSVGRNPISLLSSNFRTRPANDFGLGGTPSFRQFFRGPVGVFGGVVLRTPIDGLSLLTEYSSMNYQKYIYGGGLRSHSPVNVGLSYQPFDVLNVSVGWYYGSTFGATMTLSGDPRSSFPSGMRIGPAVPAPAVRSDADQKSALTNLQAESHQVLSVKRGRPWVEMPTPAERARQELLEAYRSGVRGVRDVEIRGNALLVDARGGVDNAKQCDGYARIASNNNASLTTIALSDLEDPTGAVTFCSIKTVAEKRGGAVQSNPENDELRRKINIDMIGQSLQLDAVWATTSELWIYYENYRYSRESQAIGRVTRVLMADAPPSVEIFHIMPVQLGVPQMEVVISRNAIERTIDAGVGPTGGRWDGITISGAPIDNPEFFREASKLYPQFSWSLDPKLTQHVFDPDAPLQFMVYGDAAGLLQLAPGLAVATHLTATLWTNYILTRDAGSDLPHVRTDLLKYLDQGKYGISELAMIYRGRLTPEVFTEVRAGYLEDMFMGAGGQVLWRPQGSRVALGANLYQVWKRDFDRLFGAQKYNVTTGHVSIYYDSPWYGLNFAVHAGRYLAGDWGGTVELSRRFDSGVEIGAWATFTNVPFSKFGEGSFDKGIMIHIPLDWALPIASQSAYDLHLNSLTRDGGQRLAGDDSLYAVTRLDSYGELAGHLDDVVTP